MQTWTEQQKEAINNPSRRIVCSAAAGSGKTAVMIERVVRMLQEGADPESFLIVTFTKAAAAEMKQKIRNRLYQGRFDKYLQRALDKIDLMEISTIHSFCQHLIRQEFQAAGADPFFSVCDPSRGKNLFSQAFRSACNALQKEQHPDYLYWKKCYTQRETEEIVSKVYAFMMSLPDSYGWLNHSCDDIPLQVDPDHPWFGTASRIVRQKIGTAKVILHRQFCMFDEPEHAEAYREVWKADAELFHVKQLWAEGKKIPPEKQKAGFIRLPALRKLNSLEIDWKDRYQELRRQLKELMEETDPLICPDPETVTREFGNMRASLQGLKEITARTAAAYTKKKKSLRLLDFNDMEHYALEILQTEPVASAVRSRYREIFVDECQDVSRVQDELVQRLFPPEGHLFMVGDVKQSIYRFRLADPGLFLSRKREYEKPESAGTLLELQTNFRSRPEILETANTVFRDIMQESVAEMDYTPREELIPGKKAEGNVPVCVDVLLPDPEKDPLEQTADEVQARAAELRQEGYTWKDMVILMPQVSRDGKKLADLLREREIPVYFDGGAGFYEQQEIAVFLQLLRWITNPGSDEAMLTSLRNAPFFFSEEEMAQVRICQPGEGVPFAEAFRAACLQQNELGDRCREAEEIIRKWRKKAAVTPMSEFVRMLCSDAHQMAMAGTDPAGNTARRNLQDFCRQAEEAEKAGVYSLPRFLSYISEHSGGESRAAVSLAEGDDVVRIMTMHKSKGLQFPVVFCLGLETEIHRTAPGDVQLDADLGICLRYKRGEARVSRHTAARKIFSWKKEQEERAERIRLLYVAMTRAQERMFLVGAGEDRVLWQTPPGEHRVLSARNYLDWIVPALLDAEKSSTGFPQAEKPWNIRIIEQNQQEDVEKKGTYPQYEEWLDSLLSAPPVENLWKDVTAEPYLDSMQKKSVTSLVRREEQDPGEEDPEETPEKKRVPDRFSAALRRTDPGVLPSFMAVPEEKKGAWRGTVIHRFLSLVELEKLRPAGENLIPPLREIREELLSEGVFTREEGEVILPEDAAAWFMSPLGRRLLASPEVRREWAFNLYLEERKLLVQGIIDCAFLEEDGWVLVDYKTDRVEDPEVFRETYRPQLRWYAEALKALTGRPVKESWLYSISRKKAYGL